MHFSAPRLLSLVALHAPRAPIHAQLGVSGISDIVPTAVASIADVYSQIPLPPAVAQSIADAYSQIPLPEEQKPGALALCAAAYASYVVVSTRVPAPDAELCDGTMLQGSKLQRVYKASIDGWSATKFHRNVDFRGPAMVIARTGSTVFGGYNPRGWSSTDDYLPSNNAFVFVRDSGTWRKLRPIGGQASIFDIARAGPQFGTEALVIGPSQSAVMGGFTGPDMENLSVGAGNLRKASSVLGRSYQRGPAPFGATLFGGRKLDATLAEIEIWCAEEPGDRKPVKRQKTSDYWKRL